MQSDQLFCARLRPGASRRIAIIDKHIAAFKPAKSLERLPKSCQTRLRFRIVLSETYQYAEPPNPLALLRTCCERPRSRRATEQRDELAPSSFNHLVGAGEQRWRHDEAERLGGLEVDDQFVLGRRLHRQVGGFLAL